MNVFLDTNALVKLYHNEKGADALDNFLNEHEIFHISISEIAIVEFHSAFMRKLRLKEIEIKNLQSLFGIFDKNIKDFNIIETNKSVIELSVRLIDKYSPTYILNTLDSIHLSSALISNQIIPVSHFITSDIKLIEVANKFLKYIILTNNIDLLFNITYKGLKL
ncbi:MAG: type II toxin-antitoxin system VapC family toxin [bacterium]